MKGNSFKCVCKTGWEGPQCEKGKRKTILQNTLDNVEIHHVNILDICVKLTSDLARMGLINFMLMTCMFPLSLQSLSFSFYLSIYSYLISLSLSLSLSVSLIF